MHGPEDGTAECERRCLPTDEIAGRTCEKRAPDDAEERQRGADVNHQIQRVVTPQVPAKLLELDRGCGWSRPQHVTDISRRERVVERKGQRHRWTASQRGPRRRLHGRRERPQSSKVRVLDDGGLVIEHERPGETVRVGDASREGDQGRREQDGNTRTADAQPEPDGKARGKNVWAQKKGGPLRARLSYYLQLWFAL